jgi:hypothetical protein
LKRSGWRYRPAGKWRRRWLWLALVAAIAGGLWTVEKVVLAPAPSPDGYVASKLRPPFHRPSCGWATRIAEAERQLYRSRGEALAAGHRPCRVCRP